MLAPAPASGTATEERMPTIDSPNDPSSFRARHREEGWPGSPRGDPRPGIQPADGETLPEHRKGELRRGASTLGEFGLQLLYVARRPRLRPADVGDEVR